MSESEVGEREGKETDPESQARRWSQGPTHLLVCKRQRSSLHWRETRLTRCCGRRRSGRCCTRVCQRIEAGYELDTHYASTPARCISSRSPRRRAEVSTRFGTASAGRCEGSIKSRASFSRRLSADEQAERADERAGRSGWKHERKPILARSWSERKMQVGRRRRLLLALIRALVLGRLAC